MIHWLILTFLSHFTASNCYTRVSPQSISMVMEVWWQTTGNYNNYGFDIIKHYLESLISSHKNTSHLILIAQIISPFLTLINNFSMRIKGFNFGFFQILQNKLKYYKYNKILRSIANKRCILLLTVNIFNYTILEI